MRTRAAGELRHADVAAVLGFLSDIRDLPFEEAYPPTLLARLGNLIPAADVTYRENDLRGRRTPRMIDAGGVIVDPADELYWRVGPCAITDYRARTGDLSAARLTDVLPWRRYRESAIYREYFRPGCRDHMLDLGLHAGGDVQRTLLLCRLRGDSDFSDRDRAVLEVLRPHVRAREARAELHRRLTHPTVESPAWRLARAEPELTPREREILLRVAEGKTNATIAVELWISPATVKKHLENVYDKLGVGSRAAAASRLRDEIRVS